MSILLIHWISGVAKGIRLEQDSLTVNPPYVVQVRHFSVEEGLPNRSVVDIGQDEQGFIWIGTFNNAYRFDGSHFKPLPKSSHPSQSQLTPYIERITPDNAGTLWFFKMGAGRDQWVERWLPKEKKLQSYSFKVNHSSLKKNGSYFPAETIGQRGISKRPLTSLVFFQEDGQVYRFRENGVPSLLYKAPTPVHIHEVKVTNTGNLVLMMWDSLQTHYSLIVLDSLGKVLRQQVLPQYLDPVCTDALGGIYLVPVGITQIAKNQLDNYLYRLEPTGKLTSLPIRFAQSPFPVATDPTLPPYKPLVVRMVFDAYHDLFWFLGKGVLFAWHPQKGIVFDLFTSGFSTAKIQDFGRLQVDKAGGVWVTSGNGFLLLTLVPNQFSRYLYSPLMSTKYPREATRGLIQVGNSLWVNAADSWLIDLRTGARQLTLPRSVIEQTNLKLQLPVILVEKGMVWSGYQKLSLIHPATKALVQYPLYGAGNRCMAITPDGRRNLWLGYDWGISYFDVAQKRNIPFTRYNRWPELAENRVNGFFPDRQAGGIWVAASSGLYLLDTLRGIMARYSVEQPAPRHLPFNNISSVHIDPDHPGIYWLATLGGGLIRWERAAGRYRQYTQTDGLLNTTLYCLYTDHPNPAHRRDKNRLWFTTDYGLVSFDKSNGQIQTYLPKDGITHEEFNFLSHFQATDGRLYFGGLNGVTAFWPNRISPDLPIKAPIVVTQLQKLDGQTGAMDDHTVDYQSGQPIQFKSSIRAFRISFALLDYRFLGQTRLWYRIPGWQDAWAMQKTNDLRINGLPSGSYQLEVRIQNIGAQWVSDTLSIPLVIQAPIYKRTWFLLLSFFAIISGIIALFRWRSRQLINETIRLEAEVANRTAQIEADKATIEQQAAKLRENDTLKSRFFANVTHEFRTPLTLLLGPLSYLLKRDSDDETHQLLTTMKQSARQLQSLVNDLLGLGKLDAGQLQLDAKPADLRQIVARTVAAFTTQASFAGLTLQTVELGRPLGMMLDIPKFETVLRNLIANALNYTPRGGEITILLSENNDQVSVSVKDTGSGIYPDDLPHIFERYYQTRQPKALLKGGTGIGLALSREYCQLWQGDLWVDSIWGQGSLFTFTYPKTEVPLPEISTSLVPEKRLPRNLPSTEIETHTDQELVLLVEDNPDMANYIQILLAPHFSQHWCRNGREASEWLNQQSATELPHLILTDMMMPEMDGMALLSALRQQPQLRFIPVIMLTARLNKEIKLKALQLGVADYLTKPFDEDELLARAHNLLERDRERTFWLTHITEDKEAGEPVQNYPLSEDEHWLHTIQQFVIDRLTDSRFLVNDLADAANMSQRQFYRRIKTITGLSPIQFVQDIRLQTAREGLELNRYKTIKEAAIEVGFQKISYFSHLFQQRYGITPGSLLTQQKVKKET